MVYRKSTQNLNMGRMARAFNALTHSDQKCESSSPASTYNNTNLSLKEQFEAEWYRNEALNVAKHLMLR